MLRHLDGRVRVSVEPELLGTAGGVANLAQWRAGRDLLLLNGDAYLSHRGGAAAIAAPLLDGWDGTTVRMLVVAAAGPADFTDAAGSWRYVGACLMPDALLRPLRVEPSGLHSRVWTPAHDAGLLELIPFDGTAIDTGTPAGYLAANLHASAGANVIGAGAQVHGRLEESVVWPGAWVGPDEVLRRTIRAGTREAPVTVSVPT